MTQKDIALVQESWARVLPAADAAMDQFYRRLFELDPDLERHFSGTDMDVQKSRLASAIDFVVSHLDQPEALDRPLQELGARHAVYAVDARDFQSVGKALLATLASGLADHWTDAHQDAWTAVWEIIVAQVMVGFHAQRAA